MRLKVLFLKDKTFCLIKGNPLSIELKEKLKEKLKELL
jgi:hypothetical protein